MTEIDLPPGQHWIAALPTSPHPPRVARADWRLTVISETGASRCWDWTAFRALRSEEVVLDVHCVEGWSVCDTRWEAVSVHHLFADMSATAEFAVIGSYGGYTTNLPLEDLLEMPTWLAFSYDGEPLPAELGGPVRLLVPHLYLYKSVRWIDDIRLTTRDQPGTYERRGLHNYGDPWREQRRSSATA